MKIVHSTVGKLIRDRHYLNNNSAKKNNRPTSDLSTTLFCYILFSSFNSSVASSSTSSSLFQDSSSSTARPLLLLSNRYNTQTGNYVLHLYHNPLQHCHPRVIHNMPLERQRILLNPAVFSMRQLLWPCIASILIILLPPISCRITRATKQSFYVHCRYLWVKPCKEVNLRGFKYENTICNPFTAAQCSSGKDRT